MLITVESMILPLEGIIMSSLELMKLVSSRYGITLNTKLYSLLLVEEEVKAAPVALLKTVP